MVVSDFLLPKLTNKNLPRALADILDRELESGEQVLWHAIPPAWAPTRKFWEGLLSNAPLLGLGLLIGIAGRLSKSSPSANISWLDVYIVFGIWLALVPITAWWTDRRTLYVITDRRALLIVAPRERRVQSFRGERLITTVRREFWGDRGDILFEREAIRGGKGGIYYRDVGFFGVREAKAVEGLLRHVYASTTADTRG